MKRISGQYPNKGRFKDFEFYVAESWEELTPQQYAHILQLLTYQKADEFTLQASLLSLLCGHKNFPVIAALEEEDLQALIPLIEFIKESRPQPKNKFPTLKINGKTYHAPNDDLSNISFGEWCFAYQFYQLYYEFGDINYLNQLVATIYRLPDPTQTDENPDFNGDIRLKFNENLIAKIAKGVADIEAHIKHAILVWFSAALLEVMDARRKVFPPVEKKVQTNQEETPENPTNWLTIFRELLGPKWGTTDQLKHTNALFVLDGLEDQHIAFEEAQKQLKA